MIKANLPDSILRSLVTDGVIAGVGAVIVFLPQILILFLFILVLEASGYMVRAAFLMDRIMASVGLSGRAFIPLLSSFACAIPGHHGDSHDRGREGPADHHPDRAADDLLRAVAGVHAGDRRVHSQPAGAALHRVAGAGDVRALSTWRGRCVRRCIGAATDRHSRASRRAS